MQCDVCHTKDATVHLTEIINKKVTKLHLCEECARAKSHEMEEHFGLADLLSGLTEMEPQEFEKKKTVAEVKIKCPRCGFGFENFRKMGRLGCPKCYEAFKDQLSPLLRKIHGSESHIGKAPVKTETVKNEKVLLTDLKARLEKAIKLEEFEEAARIRDKIRTLGKKESDKRC